MMGRRPGQQKRAMPAAAAVRALAVRARMCMLVTVVLSLVTELQALPLSATATRGANSSFWRGRRGARNRTATAAALGRSLDASCGFYGAFEGSGARTRSLGGMSSTRVCAACDADGACARWSQRTRRCGETVSPSSAAASLRPKPREGSCWRCA